MMEKVAGIFQKTPQYLQPYRTINPATNKVEKEYPFISDEDLKVKITTAHNAFNSFKKTTIKERGEKIAKLIKLVDEHRQEIADIQALEMGKPVSQAFEDIDFLLQYAKFYINNAEETLKPHEIKTSMAKKAVIHYEPLGVIYVLIPWNFPVLLNLVACIPFLMAGNTILYKGANTTPQSSEVAERLYKEAGFNNGEFINIFVSPEKNEDILADPRIKGVSFTGNTLAGEIVAQIASKYAKKAVLELGGSDAYVVLDDADVEKAAKNAAVGRLLNAGQSCDAPKRILVDKKVSQEFIKLFIEEFSSWKIADPKQAGKIIGPLARDDVSAALKHQTLESVKKGAKLIYGDEQELKAATEPEKGNYFSPMVLLNPPKDSPAYKEELFGPVATIIEISGEHEAVEIANDCRYGLGGTVFGKDLDRALRIASQIESGSVHINEYGSFIPEMPFGGAKESGIGRHSSADALKEFVNIKAIVIHE